MKQILLIEDNHDHAELIERAIAKDFHDVKVVVAGNAKEAYAILKSNEHFDLILTDYYLPDAKGETHIRQLHKKAPHIPIVVVTGQGDEKIAARSIKAGAEDYVVKTRDVLAALPRILKRTIVKHHSHQSKRRREMQKQISEQKKTVQKVLGEMESLDKKMKQLQKTKIKKVNPRSKSLAAKVNPAASVELIVKQVDSLKNFIKKMFSNF